MKTEGTYLIEDEHGKIKLVPADKEEKQIVETKEVKNEITTKDHLGWLVRLCRWLQDR